MRQAAPPNGAADEQAVVGAQLDISEDATYHPKVYRHRLVKMDASA